MEEIINYMKSQGWEEVDGSVRHPDLDQDFTSWTDAVKSCIDLATEV